MGYDMPRMMMYIAGDVSLDNEYEWQEYMVAPAILNLNKYEQIEWLKEQRGRYEWKQDGDVWVANLGSHDIPVFRIDVSTTDKYNMETYGRYNYGAMIMDDEPSESSHA